MKSKDLPLHLKYRPKSFDEFIGNESTVESLKTILSRKEGIPHAFLFQGPSGCGKTTLARIVAKELGCDEREFHEFNIANVRGIDTVREIIQQCRFAPIRGDCRVYVLDECHQFTVDAQNALLKVLEDTPSHVYFILCTTNPEKLVKTIRNRCSTFQVSSLPPLKIIRLLKKVCKEEGIEFSNEIYRAIAKASQGSPRKALVLLDSVKDLEDEEEILEAITSEIPDEVEVVDICRILLDQRKSPELKWKEISKILERTDQDPEQVRYVILNYLSKVLLGRVDNRIAEIINLFIEPFVNSGKAGLIYSLYLACFVR